MNKKALFLQTFIGLIPTHSYSQSTDEHIETLNRDRHLHPWVLHKGTITITPSFVSSYMDYGVRTGGFCFQPTLEYSKGPVALELFANFPIADKVPGSSDPEIDYSAYYTWDILPNIFTIKPSVCLYTYPRANEDDGFYKNTWESRISFDYTFNKMTFSLYGYYDVTMKGGGWEFGINRLITDMTPLEADVELSVLIGRYSLSDSTNEPIKIKNKGDYYQVGLSVPIAFSDQSQLSVGLYYTKGTNNYFWLENGTKELNPDAIGQFVFQLSFSQSFNSNLRPINLKNRLLSWANNKRNAKMRAN